MILPVRIDRQLQTKPLVNYALIAANVLVFVFFQRLGVARPVVRMYLLNPDEPHLYQFFASMFMHADVWHLVGNMIFLWVFGNAVNDVLGHVGYLAFYLGGGLIAGLGYVLLSGVAPVLGASGAISAVTGAFLVLLPRVRVTVVMFLPLIILMPFEISSLVFLALQFGWNLYASMAHSGGGVAYVAHASGYVFGIAVVAVLLAARLIPRDVYDLVSLMHMWRRRRDYRRTVSGGHDPFGAHRMGRGPTDAARRPVEAKTVASEPPADAKASAPPADAEARELALRRRIADDHRRGNFPVAAEGYLRLVQIADDAVLPLTQQLDVANYLMSASHYAPAADAYERFCSHYGRYEYLSDIWLMLGLLYSRYLDQAARAEAYLSRAIGGLTDENKAAMARAELSEVRRRLR